jgi:hypothetical protein
MKAKQSQAQQVFPSLSLSNFTSLSYDAVNLAQEDRKLGLGAEIGVCEFVWVKFGEPVTGF